MLVRRISGYSRRIRHEWCMWRLSRWNHLCLRRYNDWISKLNSHAPDVLIGPDLPYGGVRGHMRAIKRFSSLDITLVPDEQALGGLNRFTGECREQFMAFNPPGRPVLHSHVIPWFIQWCECQQRRGLRWVHTYHLPYFPEHGCNGLKPDQIEINEALTRHACHADVRISVSRWQQDYLQNEYAINTIYLPNGVDVDACDRGSPERFRRKFGISGPFVLYIGRNDPVKNPVDYVKLSALMPDHQFMMAGNGLDALTLATDLQVECPPNLRAIGQLSHAGVQDALAACSVLVVTSFREGLPTLVLEAMAHAKPVVAIEEDGSAEALGYGEFGHLVPRENFHALAEAVEKAPFDAAKPLKARKRVLAEYDWRVVAPKLDAIYRGEG